MKIFWEITRKNTELILGWPDMAVQGEEKVDIGAAMSLCLFSIEREILRVRGEYD